ncbi:MAG: hypothetical protein RMJ43_00985 [Chloroherpetonaceae bacterium]|nr:hypothetical protein [Chthonomonadaceae bacterium]MDW8206383.1 hypothetical protein [Chloroherpetonaceae bacterium]
MTQNHGVRRAGAGLIIAGLLLPLAGLAGQNGPVTLRMKFKPGETLKYQTTLQMNIETPMMAQNGAMKMDISMVQNQKVLKALPAGGGDVEVTTTDTRASMNGQPMSLPSNPPVTLTYDAQGNVRGVKGLPKDAAPLMGGGMAGANQMQLQGTFLPAKPVKPGDTWTMNVKLPGTTGGNAVVKGQFLKMETIGRYRTAKIRTVLTGPMNLMMNAQGQPTTDAKQAAMKMTGTMTMTVDSNLAITEGRLIRQAGNGVMRLTMKPIGSTAGSGTAAKGNGQLPNSMAMTMKMRMGSNLIE